MPEAGNKIKKFRYFKRKKYIHKKGRNGSYLGFSYIHSFDNMFLFSNHNVTHMNVSKQYKENRGVRAFLTIRNHQIKLLPSSNFLPKIDLSLVQYRSLILWGTVNLYCDNRGIKHDFPFINIRKVPREVLKTEGVARGFQPSRGTLRILMNDKIMFDRYYCIN